MSTLLAITWRDIGRHILTGLNFNKKQRETSKATHPTIFWKRHWKKCSDSLRDVFILWMYTHSLPHATILDKINGKPRPPLPPKSRMVKWRVFALRAPSSLIWGGWGFAVPFYFVQDCSCTERERERLEICYYVLEGKKLCKRFKLEQKVKKNRKRYSSQHLSKDTMKKHSRPASNTFSFNGCLCLTFVKVAK